MSNKSQEKVPSFKTLAENLLPDCFSHLRQTSNSGAFQTQASHPQSENKQKNCAYCHIPGHPWL